METITMEIRAGTGGDEAALFASDLFRMYSRFSEKQSWVIKILESSTIGIGGYKEIKFQIKGDSAYDKLKQEAGVHRVQRIPKTEKSGRIHTSAVSVAVLQGSQEPSQINLLDHELKIEAFRGSGPGGQHRNVTDSAIRITHIPTGVVASCQDEKSQHKNKAKAMSVLKQRLQSQAKSQYNEEVSQERKEQIGTADRSEKIRTYNFPQNRITDHRVGKSWQNLERILNGDLYKIIKVFKK
ncbi:hypothetical protein CL633_00445 [bacterium]|nr:hypothetical protein [bacterium]|tara:strand:+ start:7296 stop:8015 length:720 start_codon:yes stop_codon:yes gene_type:complete